MTIIAGYFEILNILQGSYRSGYCRSGGSTVDDCQPCPPGHYCDQIGLAEPSGQCAAGYYCPGGQSTDRPSQHVCGVGHFCKEGSVRERACAPGSYQPSEGQHRCEVCPSGFYCLEEGRTHLVPCGRGFYCPRGTANQHPCPSGTYGNLSGLADESECSLCEPGMYCKGTGRIYPSGPCSAGFVCFGAASQPSPSDNITGAPCPPGFHCPVGSSVPTPCPKGTFSVVDVFQGSTVQSQALKQSLEPVCQKSMFPRFSYSKSLMGTCLSDGLMFTITTSDTKVEFLKGCTGQDTNLGPATVKPTP
ncbi:scavenger receptor class F member 1-like [Oncorhynchus kisutch]|uniref:scavenger receptor class F member 1-like n=1 Tax=Oncorhynchus kisutch TaxID=8019 RepID=UPI0012DC4DBF|nr:scavenger receptor class F member 1-like [Oncorhynchus kisutch]